MLAQQPAAIETRSLSNGMKILIQEDHNIPNVAMYLFYKIGSRNERPGTTGLSHFFEHMMFNGAKKYGPKQFDIQMEKAGGSNNAYTTTDVTVYTNWFPSTALDLMFDMEADRIRDLAFDPKIVESERGVVYSERRTNYDNQARGALFLETQAAAIIAHPYHWPVIGWSSDIEAWTMDDLKAHFKMGYAPNNCTMVVVGDTNVEQVMALAKKYIEPIPSQPPPPPIRTKEPEQIGERRVIVEKPAQLGALAVAYHIPESNHPDTAVLEVLNDILAGGQSSRLYKRLVDTEQIALNAGAFTQDHFDPGLWIFFIQPRAGIEGARVEKVLFEELDKLQTAPVTEAARILERGKLKLDPERHTCHWNNLPVTLTVTEFLILQALATRPGVVKTRDALMDAAYDDQVYVDDRTIDSHIKRLRKKFKVVDDDFDVIETLYGVGYRFKE